MEKPFAITLDVGSSRANKTGSWRTERAVYVERKPPCNHACPAGEDIQSWLYDAEEGGDGYERAWRTIMATNPLPLLVPCHRVVAAGGVGGYGPGPELKVRLLMARRQLEQTSTPVGEIAHECGFYDQSHFTRAFRKSIGLRPLEYRARFAPDHSTPR